MPRMYFVAGLWAICVVQALLPAVACRGEDAHVAVPALERPESVFADDPAEAGRLLLVELNCLACHAGTPPGMTGFSPRKEAPDLSGVTSRARMDYLRTMIANPQQAKPGTAMPQLPLAKLEAGQAQIEALVHFLAAPGEASVVDSRPDMQAAKRGRQLFDEVGCAACHDRPFAEGRQPLASSVPLGNLTDKYSATSLAKFLRDPLAVRHSGRMPSLNLTEQESRDLAHALVKRWHLSPNLNYRYYEGDWDELPDFSQLKPKATGQAAGFDLGVAKRANEFAMEFEGVLTLAADGKYLFYLRSDDGGRLIIDDELVIDNDGRHPETEKVSDRRVLTAGPHRVLVQYFDHDGEKSLDLEYECPKIVPRQGLDAAITLTRDAPQPTINTFKVDPQLAAEGARQFASLGCAACHSMKQEGKAIASKLSAPRLDKLRPERGCLASQPPASALRFALSQSQRGALQAALSAIGQAPEKRVPPEKQIERTLATFNCYGCHQRNKRGGVEAARNDFFLTTAHEMGDEARIPPTLDGVGAKLTDGWMKKLLQNGGKDRPYMLTRMPRFGGDNVGHLTALFAKVDEQPAGPPPPKIELPEYRIKSEGRFLVGGRAFSCVKCHNFGKFQGEGIQAIDMMTMTRRLRPEWFRRYLRDPAALRPGTRMPAAWPKTGRSMLRDVLGGDSAQQIEAVWLYLSDGKEASPPFGAGHGAAIELVADQEPIVYRNFIEGAGPRGIAVGYPEKVNLAIDINHLQLMLIWRGPFIDASMHWSNRSAGFQGPLGDQTMPLVGGVPLAELESLNQSWPGETAKALGYQFRGYDLDAQRRPTFHSQWHDLKIDDFFLPAADESSPQPDLQRTLTITGRPAGQRSTYFRAARSPRGIEVLADHWYLIEKAWKMRLESSAGQTPVIRTVDGQAELLVPLDPAAERQTIQQTFRW